MEPLSSAANDNVSNYTIVAFLCIVGVIAVISLVGLTIASYPPEFFIRFIHKKKLHASDQYYFYYQKATAYRLLSIFHTIFTYGLKVLGTTTTFITVYFALSSSSYVVFCALLASLSQVLSLLVPFDKYMKIFVESARKLEYKLLEQGEDEIILNDLNILYQEVEIEIAKAFA